MKNKTSRIVLTLVILAAMWYLGAFDLVTGPDLSCETECDCWVKFGDPDAGWNPPPPPESKHCWICEDWGPFIDGQCRVRSVSLGECVRPDVIPTSCPGSNVTPYPSISPGPVTPWPSPPPVKTPTPTPCENGDCPVPTPTPTNGGVPIPSWWVLIGGIAAIALIWIR